MAKRTAITSMNIGMFLIPVSALLMACGNLLGSDVIAGMSNITLMMILGIVVQALAECFISPRYLEYFSLQAPEGEEGMYLGFSHLHSFLSSIFGFGIAGVLLTKYCPDPALFASREAWEAASMNAHYIWYYFAGIGLVAAVALLIFAKTTEFIDKKKKYNLLYCIFSVYLSPNAKTGCFRHNLSTLNSASFALSSPSFFLKKSDGFL